MPVDFAALFITPSPLAQLQGNPITKPYYSVCSKNEHKTCLQKFLQKKLCKNFR